MPFDMPIVLNSRQSNGEDTPPILEFRGTYGLDMLYSVLLSHIIGEITE